MSVIAGAPQTVDVSIYRGDTASIKLACKTFGGSAIDLSTWSVKSTIYNLSNIAVGNGWIAGTPNSSGELYLFLPDGTSDLLQTGFTYDVEIWKNTTITELGASKLHVITVARGMFTITADITDGTGTGRGGT